MTDAETSEAELDETMLHRWQTELLQRLLRGEAPEAIQAALLADPELRPLHAHVAGLDLHALAVAVELVAEWRPVTQDDPSDSEPE